MVKQIIRDEEILTKTSIRFIFGEDDYLIKDMLDTANHYADRCIGLAAIQIGVPKRVIAVRIGSRFVIMINPTIVGRSPKTYLATESCMSLDGSFNVKRHKEIKLIYTKPDGVSECRTFKGREAQIIQHECDHLHGILI